MAWQAEWQGRRRRPLRGRVGWALAGAVMGLLALPVAAWGRMQDDPPGLRPGSSLPVPATHAARSRGLTVVAGPQAIRILSHRGPALRGRSSRDGLPLPGPVAGLAAIDRRAFLTTEDGRLLTLDLTRPESAEARPLSLGRPLAGATRLAGMDDYLVLAESGAGITLLEVNPPHACGETTALDGTLAATGSYPLREEFTAVTATDRRIYAATITGEIVVLDATVAALPTLVETMSTGGRIRALAANGARVYILADDGLSILETDADPAARLLHRPDIQGTALTLAGRELQVGSLQGLVTWLDADPAPQVIRVTVGNNFFSPEDIVLRPGDTVSWRNLSGFHNVVSCTEFGFGCERGPAVEFFSSGPVSGPPWLFAHTFTVPGFNPYRCIPHAPFMVGTVTTEEPAPPPLEVDLDIRPGSCVNPLNGGSRGVLPAAVLGRADLDVTLLDPARLRLAGVPPLRWSLEDVGAPGMTPSGEGDCATTCPGGPDGILDLALKFDSAAVAAAAGVMEGEACLLLELTGSLSQEGQEREVTGRDAVSLRPERRAGGR